MKSLPTIAAVILALAGAARVEAAEPGKRHTAKVALHLNGQWRAAPLVDGEGKPVGDVPDLASQLDFAGLPRDGEVVRAGSGTLCIADQQCHGMIWTKTTALKLEGGPRLVEDLHLAPGAPVFIGSTGSTRSQVTLVPGSGGALRALFGACGANASNCRNVWQPWVALTPDAGFSPGR